MAKIGHSNIYSKFDLKSGFHQVAMHPDSIEWTAFWTPLGLYEWLVMPFGLKNAPAVFQRKMDNCFKGTEEYIAVYIDDILVFSPDEKSHANLKFSSLVFRTSLDDLSFRLHYLFIGKVKGLVNNAECTRGLIITLFKHATFTTFYQDMDKSHIRDKRLNNRTSILLQTLDDKPFSFYQDMDKSHIRDKRLNNRTCLLQESEFWLQAGTLDWIIEHKVQL